MKICEHERSITAEKTWIIPHLKTKKYFFLSSPHIECPCPKESSCQIHRNRIRNTPIKTINTPHTHTQIYMDILYIRPVSLVLIQTTHTTQIYMDILYIRPVSLVLIQTTHTTQIYMDILYQTSQFSSYSNYTLIYMDISYIRPVSLVLIQTTHTTQIYIWIYYIRPVSLVLI